MFRAGIKLWLHAYILSNVHVFYSFCFIKLNSQNTYSCIHLNASANPRTHTYSSAGIMERKNYDRQVCQRRQHCIYG